MAAPAYDDAVSAAVVQQPAQPTGSDAALLAARLSPAMPAGGWRGWIGPLLVTALATVLRLWDLGRPHVIAFDETYYPKDALALLKFGVERAFVDNANDQLLRSDGSTWRTLDLFTGDPAFVVHPPLGKWTIALGEAVFGATPFGWRISVAVLGVIAVLLTARIARRLTRSNLIGTIAGLLLAIDGMHLVLSRTGLLDLTLGFWVLVAFGCLLLDRDRTRRRLAALVRAGSDPAALALGRRPWRWAAVVALALACSVKWSALWFVAAFLLMSLLWDVGLRRSLGVQRPWIATALRAVPFGLASIAIVVVLYTLSWTGWFLSDLGYARDWAQAQGPSIVPDALRSLWHYHGEAWRFHVGLNSPHSYASNPLSWPFQTRPTSFSWETVKEVTDECPSGNCAAEVLALGNPVIWWAGIIAMVHQLWRWAARRDWRSGAVLCGIAAGWLPWLLYLDRTIFTFYTVVYVPFLVMALAMSLGTVIGPRDAPESRRQWGAFAAGAVILAAVIVAWWMYPIWTGVLLPYDLWQLRMWMPTWI